MGLRFNNGVVGDIIQDEVIISEKVNRRFLLAEVVRAVAQLLFVQTWKRIEGIFLVLLKVIK